MSATLSHLERATIDATPDFFVSSMPQDDAQNDDEESLFDFDANDLAPIIGAFDDDELWREVAKTGRAL